MADNKIIGIDIGSRSIKVCILNGGKVEFGLKVPSTFDPVSQCRRVLEEMGFNSHSAGDGIKKMVATGYGRDIFEKNFKGNKQGGESENREEKKTGGERNIENKGWEITTITEIQAFALGSVYLYPHVKTVLDIGGQDTKVISLNSRGRVSKFEMNDRCAAGTGKFLEFMANTLQIPIESFGDYALKSRNNIKISSMCAVFAESEIISLISQGASPEDIALGIHRSILTRIQGMLGKVGVSYPLMFAGGVAHNPCMVALLKEEIKGEVFIPSEPDMVGALGSALYGGKTQE